MTNNALLQTQITKIPEESIRRLRNSLSRQPWEKNGRIEVGAASNRKIVDTGT
jgi:hypothetical protein